MIENMLRHRYQELRSKAGYAAETWYNTGRVYHQLSLHKFAIRCYQRCFVLLDGEPEDLARVDQLSLRRACAYNLHLCYCHAGNFPMAQKVLFQHICV